MRKIINLLFVFLLIINIAYVVSGVVNFNIRSIDVYAIWMYKTKAFFLTKGIDYSFLKNAIRSHPQYPVLLPLLYSKILLSFGKYNEFYILGLYPLYYILIIALAYKVFRKVNIHKTCSLLFVYIYSMFGPLLAQAGRNHAGTADIVITLIFWLITYLLVAGYKISWFYGFLIAIASQIKQEAVFLFPLILILPVKKKDKLLGIVVALIPTIAWRAIVVSKGIQPDFSLETISVFEFVKRLIIIIKYLLLEMINVRNWYIFWPVFFMVFMISNKLKDNEKLLIKSSIAYLLLIFMVYIYANIDTASYVFSSIDRIMLQLSPFFYTLFIVNISRILKQTN